MKLPLISRLFEKRDVQFSPELSRMLASGHLGTLSVAGVGVTQETALRFMAVLACVRVIAEDVASLPLPLYRRLSRGKERAIAHPMYEMIHSRPNSEQTSFEWRETMTAHALLWGNAYAEIVRQDGWPAQLWPIMPNRVTVRRNSETQELEYIVSPPGDIQRRFTGQQIFHLKGIATNGVIGRSLIDLGRDAIGLGLASQEFASGFFANGARPSAVLEHPGVLSEEAHNRLRSDFEATHAGLSNAQRIALLEEGMKLNTGWQMPLEDAQFIQNRKLSIEEICRLFRVQPHKVGALDRATFNNVEHLSIDHVISTIRPWLVRWEQAIQNQLIPEEERDQFFAEFIVEGLLRGDSEGRAKLYKALWEMGALSPNDIRELENMNPVDGGDDYYVPLNFGKVGALEAPPEPEIAPSRGRNGRTRGVKVP